MSDLLDHNEFSKPPSIFKQLQSLASEISSETKRLQGNIITVGEHPHLYDGAANELIDEVSKLKKEAVELDPQSSNVEFSTFILSARQQLTQHQRHADRLQLYIEKYGYKAPAHTPNAADSAGGARTSPSADDGTLYPDLLCELLSPELSASSQQLTAPDRYGPYRSSHTDLMPPPQSTKAARAGFKDSSRTPSAGAVCSAPRAPSPPTPTACSPVFKIPFIKIRKPTECESLASSFSAERPSHGDDVTVPDTAEPFKRQQTTSSSARSGLRKSVSSSALAQPKYDAASRTRHDRLINKCRTTPTAASPCVGHRVAGGGARSVAADHCFVTPNTKQSVEVWLQSVRSKQTPVCSPSPLQFHLPKRQINNPLLENLPSRRTPLRTPVKLQVSSASPDFSSRKPIQRTLAAKDLGLQNSPSPKSDGSDHQIKTLGPEPGTNQPISVRVKNEKVEASSSVFSRFAKVDEDLMLDSSLEEPVLSETTVNLLAEMTKARAVDELKTNGSCHPHIPPPTKARSRVSQPVPHHQEAVPSRSLTWDVTDQPIDYSFKILVLPSQAKPSASNELPKVSARSTQAEMPTDLATKYALNGNSHRLYGCQTSKESVGYSNPSETKFNEVRVKNEFDTPEEQVLRSDYSKRFETKYGAKEIDTPEEPILFSDRASRATDLDTPEEPVLLSDYSKQAYGATNVQEVNTPEEPKLNIKYRQQEHSYGLPDSPEEPTLSIHGQRAIMASLIRTETEPPSRNNLIFENIPPGNSHAYKQSVDGQTSSAGPNLLSSHRPNLLPPCVQQLIDDDDFVDKSPELSNASKRMMLDRQQNYATYCSQSESVKEKYDFTREKENIPPSSSVSHQKSSSTGSALIDRRHMTDDTKRASIRPKPVFEEDTLERELDTSSLRIGAGNESMWNNSSLLHDQSGQSRRVAANQSFSQAMLQYSHVKASPMPTPATSRIHRHHPSQP